MELVGAFIVVGASAFYSISVFVSVAALPAPTNRMDLYVSTISVAVESFCFSHTKAVAIFLRTSTAAETGVRCAGLSALVIVALTSPTARDRLQFELCGVPYSILALLCGRPSPSEHLLVYLV